MAQLRKRPFSIHLLSEFFCPHYLLLFLWLLGALGTNRTFTFSWQRPPHSTPLTQAHATISSPPISKPLKQSWAPSFLEKA